MTFTGRVIHFEIHADDPERAAKFYEKALGWKIQKWEGPMEYWMVTTGKDGPGIDGGIMRRMEGGSTWNTVDVENLDKTVEKIVKAGGRQVSPKQAVPGIGWAAYCADSEGNVFGLMQSDPAAG